MANQPRNPLVSVIIPTYNRACLIGPSIKSVIQQTYRNLEILVIDDASEDNTRDAVHAFEDARITYIRHDENRGGAAARNTGIQHAKGTYVAFLDSDDVWLPVKIERQLTAFTNLNQGEDIVSYTQFVNECIPHTSILPRAGIHPKESVAEYLFVNEGEILTSTLMLPRNLASTVLFRPELEKHQDLDFCMRLEAKGALFAFLKRPMTIWHNEPREDRVSALADYSLSLEWIREYKGIISTKAFNGFMIKEILPKLFNRRGKFFYSAYLIVDAALHQAISLEKAAMLFLNLMATRRPSCKRAKKIQTKS